MPLFIDEAVDKKLDKKTTVIPKSIHNLALKVKGEYGMNKKQDGYKTVNKLLDDSYNKNKKSPYEKDDSIKVDKNDGLTKFPTSSARKMIGNLKNEKDFIDPVAKNTIMNYLKSDVKSKESAVKDNNMVPKVPKLAKPPTLQNNDVKKLTKVGNLNVSIHESKKIIHLSENQLLLLK